jgi:predicted transcriptional regulator
MMLDECKARLTAAPKAVHYRPEADGATLVIRSALSHDNEPWPADEIEAIAAALGVEAGRVVPHENGCPCCGYDSSVAVVGLLD